MTSLMLSRRRLLAASSAALALGAAPVRLRAAEAAPLILTADTRVLEVNGKPATVFGIRRPDGGHGLTLAPGQRFRVDLTNRAGEETVIHWHGQTPPWTQDGVADTTRPTLAAGETRAYDFDARSGTHWMHSHHGLQEQKLMAAPLVVRTAQDDADGRQEVTVLLHDFTFRDPAEVLAGLTGGAMSQGGMDHGAMNHGSMEHGSLNHGAMDHGSMDHGSMDHGAMNHGAAPAPAMDLNDVEYDAYLANDRTLADPEVVRVERGGRVRLRLINGATSTAFWIDLGRLTGTVVAVDGTGVAPVAGQRFPMTMGQRLDIAIDLPADGGAFPILALREGDKARTGIVLATAGAAVRRVAERGDTAAPPVDLSLETRLSPLSPLTQKPADVRFTAELTGGMAPYVWSINGQVHGQHSPLRVSRGQRVEIDMVNPGMMAHPMHLHGHHFQVVAVNGAALAGAVRDTVLVPAGGSVRIAFDADNPGRWPFHCHNLLHMAVGMMTEVVYDGVA